MVKIYESEPTEELKEILLKTGLEQGELKKLEYVFIFNPPLEVKK